MNTYVVLSVALVLIFGQTQAQMGWNMMSDGPDFNPWMGGMGMGGMGMGGMGMGGFGMNMWNPWGMNRMFPMGGMTGLTGMGMLGGGDGMMMGNEPMDANMMGRYS